VSHLETAVASATGRVRSTNEDSTLCVALDRGEGGQWLLAAADGVGGVDGGEVASTAVVSELAAYVGHLRDAGESDAETLLREGFAAAREEFAAYAAARGFGGAGTTLVAAVVDAGTDPSDGATATVLNVGDSRAYVYDAGVLRQVTTDHTVGQERGSPGGAHGHVLSRWVGAEQSVDPDLFVEPLSGTLLLCSDGLTNELSDEAIRDVLAGGGASADLATALVDRALAHGGRDNVSVVLATVRA
jgi:protein phosphatase